MPSFVGFSVSLLLAELCKKQNKHRDEQHHGEDAEHPLPHDGQGRGESSVIDHDHLSSF